MIAPGLLIQVFLLIQYIDDNNIEKGVKIIHSGSNMLPPDRDFRSMEAEAIAFDHVISACHHWLYYYSEIEFISDCQGLIGLLNKHTADVDNRSLKQILEWARNYNWLTKHIRGKHNKVADALSRLCKTICTYS